MTSLTLDPTAHGTGDKTASPKSVLMCRPDYFTVAYRINPWMFPENPTDQSKALNQWNSLYEAYLKLGIDVDLIEPIPGLPDMVYAANGGMVVDGIAYSAKFRHDERAAEGPAYLAHLASKGFTAHEAEEINEGEGDFLVVGDVILAAWGFRSDKESHDELRRVFEKDVISLKLINPSYYHLDTALAVLDEHTIAYYPGAFDDESLAILRTRYPDAILASEEDAAVLGLNLFSDGRNVIMAEQAVALRRDIDERGFTTHGVNLSELLLGGGGVKCCTLELRR
jgi:N-dimethylarginine dimethylaminohydrolase